jgi:hypothetical protein
MINFFFNKKIVSKYKPEVENIITFSTCWYILKSKFDSKTYFKWIQNILSIVNNFNLVIYTDDEGFKQLSSFNILIKNPKIKIIVKPFQYFHTYRFKDSWIKNHETSNLPLHLETDWKLNMLWNEKVFFVNETIKNKYFNTFYYGWIDIGYFRNRKNDLNTGYLSNWPNHKKLLHIPFSNNIHYGCVQNDVLTYIKKSNDIKNHYTNSLTTPPSTQLEDNCFAGGFFILKRELIDIYTELYLKKLVYYFTNNFIIKDDQTIINDIIFTNPDLFYTHTEDNKEFDNWFMFQRLLL